MEKSLRNEERSVLKASIQQLENGLAVADSLITEGNDDFKKLLLRKNSTRKDLQTAQSKIETGVKKRKELFDQKEVLEKKMKEL